MSRQSARTFLNAGRIGYGTLIADLKGNQVAVMYSSDINPMAESDAKLFLAAPDLLDALERVIPFMEAAEKAGLVGHEGCYWPVEIVRAAIAKAKDGAR